MAKRATFLKSCSNLIGDRRGNLGMMAALLVPVLFAAGGVAIDMTNMMLTKDRLQDATDAAALAAASALVNDGLSTEQAKELAKDFVKSQMQSDASLSAEELAALEQALADNTTVDITEQTATGEAAAVGNSKTYVVDVSSKFDLPLNALTRLLGEETAEIGTASKSLSSSESKNALSMFLVLDRSGSMAEDTATVDVDNPTKVEYYACGTKKKPTTCSRDVPNYVVKIDALKTATENLMTYMKTADPTASLVRTGAVSYNASMQKQTDLAWGTDAVGTYVNALTATGGTDSGDAFKTAYQKLVLKKNETEMVEDAAHSEKNKQVPTKYIVFMTDGDNNYTSADTTTKYWCDEARNDGIQVFTVAFMAPERGQALLNYCATSSDHYFAAENAEQLNAAFEYIGEKASAMTVRLTK